MNHDRTLPPCLAHCMRYPQNEDDELPPVIGERYRDIVLNIHRAACEAQQEETDHE